LCLNVLISQMKAKLYPYLPGVLLFIIALLISIFTFKDYGVAWDEPIQVEIGTVYYNYVAQHDTKLETYDSREYGAGFELPLIFLQKKLRIDDSRNVYLFRHFVTHLFFLIAAFCAYLLCYRLFQNRLIASLGFILIVCMPRIYAHSYFNTKDIPLLSMFLVTFTVAQAAFKKNKAPWYLLLGMACGYTISIRITGILPVAMLTVFLLVDMVTCLVNKKNARKAVMHLFIFIFSSTFTLYLCWPTLWHHPLKNFIWAYNTLAHFSNWGGKLLFMGQVYDGNTIPWYYAPVWFGISTPILWLIAGITGIVFIIVAFLKRPLSFIQNTPYRNYTLYLACFFGPLLMVIALHSVLYDDWRHLYFIYPAFALLALYAVNALLHTKWKRIVYALCLMQVALVMVFMVRAHPFQQVYFNQLVSHKDESHRKNYELEYWGCAYKQAFDYILAHDSSDSIRVFWSLNPVINNVDFLPAEYRKRFLLLNRNEVPYYFITNFRGHPQDFNYPYTYYNIKVQNSTILRVYKCYKEEGK